MSRATFHGEAMFPGAENPAETDHEQGDVPRSLTCRPGETPISPGFFFHRGVLRTGVSPTVHVRADARLFSVDGFYRLPVVAVERPFRQTVTLNLGIRLISARNAGQVEPGTRFGNGDFWGSPRIPAGPGSTWPASVWERSVAWPPTTRRPE